MPYIAQSDRNIIDEPTTKLINCAHYNAIAYKGCVNYVITRIVLGVLRPTAGWGYESLSNAISVLRDCECELRRRLLDPYEDGAVAQNGDVTEIHKESFRS